MLDIKVSAALLGYTQEEQRIILSCFREQKEAPTARLRKGVDLVADVYENHVEVVEGYAGFPIDKALIDKNKQTFKDDRNIGRVVTMGGNSMVITGKKSDGRYSVVGKKGEKTAKRPEDLGLSFQREHIDIEDLHQMMVEKMDGKDDNGFKSCWKGYKKQGTKMKGGKEVNNCVKEEEQIDELYKGKHGQSEKEYQDGRSDAGKRISGDSESGPRYYTLGRSRGARPDAPTKPGAKPVNTPKLSRDEKEYHQYNKNSAKSRREYNRVGGSKGLPEGFDAFLEDVILDEEFDILTFEELEEICTEALLELDEELLTEALNIIDDMTLLTEVMDRKEIQRRRDQAKDRLATGAAMKKAAASSAASTTSSDSGSSAVGSRREKVKAALKTAASNIKKGAKKVVGGAAEVAGAAAGGFRKGYSDARGKSESEPKRSDSGSHSSERVSGSSSSSSSGSSSSSSSSSDEGRVRLRDRIKSGIKSAIGSAARVVSRKARSVARRLGEEQQAYSWREAMGVDE